MISASKKAVVIGGSNGMGLSVSRELIDRGLQVEILDITAPEEGVLDPTGYHHTHCDLTDFDEELMTVLSEDQDVQVLFISAGIGRIAKFEYFDPAEIDKTYTIDATSTAKVLSIFYHRIKSDRPFYTGVMGSIAGWLSSPYAAVYSAAKAGIVRLIESVNIELEADGCDNRILDVSPSSFKGSRFYGGENDPDLLSEMAETILQKMESRETRYIPHYEDTFKGVLERYHKDPHEYGLHSYQYKEESGRIDNRKKTRIGYMSGTFDLFHIGHLNILRRAKSQCDYLIVGVHESGKWKGKETFIPLEERKAIVGSCQYVDKVVDSCREDADAWDLWHYDRLFVGSDYKGSERFQRYEEYFADKGVEIIYFPYTKGTSSTKLREALTQNKKEE